MPVFAQNSRRTEYKARQKTEPQRLTAVVFNQFVLFWRISMPNVLNTQVKPVYQFQKTRWRHLTKLNNPAVNFSLMKITLATASGCLNA